jgi:hypothetical protein
MAFFVSAPESRGCAEEIHFTLNQYGLETQRHRGHREEPARAEHLNQFQHSEAVDWWNQRHPSVLSEPLCLKKDRNMFWSTGKWNPPLDSQRCVRASCTGISAHRALDQACAFLAECDKTPRTEVSSSNPLGFFIVLYDLEIHCTSILRALKSKWFSYFIQFSEPKV